MTLRLNGTSSGFTEIDAPAAAGSNKITLPTSNGSAEQFLKNSGTAGELEFSSMVETSTGIGIGTSSPSYKLHVTNDSSAAARIGGASNYLELGEYASNSSPAISYNGSGASLPIRNGTSEVARFDSSGRLLVGTSSSQDKWNNSSGDDHIVQIESPSSAFSQSWISHSTSATAGVQLDAGRSRGTSNGSTTLVNSEDLLGHLCFQGADGSQFVRAALIQAHVDGTPGSNDMPGRLTFHTTADGASSPTEALRIDSAQRLISVPTYNATSGSSGNVGISSSGKFYRSTSSGKYKTNVETIQDSYADALLECRPVWYRSLCANDNPEHGYWGFIAEEVAEIDPRLVFWKTAEITQDENGSNVETVCDPEPEGVAYDRFVPHLLNLIKRQQSAIETLETQNTAQQTQIDDLLARVTALEAA